MTTVPVAGRAPGLTAAEVDQRRQEGLTNDVPVRPSRTFGQIVRANVFTRFNALLGGLFVVILVAGEANDALFGGVLIANTLIGIVQETRAKRTLDQLAVLNAPRAVVRRDGEDQELDVDAVVLDDVLLLRTGDQIVVDGELLETHGLEVDESLLTGESDPVTKDLGDQVQSGSFVAAGTGAYRATKVGKDAYAVQLAAEARRFTLVKSELYLGIDRIIRLVSWAMIPTGALLLASQVIAHGTGNPKAIVGGTVAGLVAMVPEGLVLLTSIAFAVSVVRLGRRQVLVQELPAVETLARVDVICLDKTGTLTSGAITFDSLEVCDDFRHEDVVAALAGVVEADPDPNPTLRAVADGLGPTSPGGQGTSHWAATRFVPFSSARKWSGGTFGDRGTWILGAPDVVLAGSLGALADSVKEHAEEGRRVLVLASTDRELAGEVLPERLRAAGLVLLDDEVRAEAPDTLRYFAGQGVAVKVISGDHPRTVAAIAQRAGVEVTGEVVDAADLPEDPVELGELLQDHTVFGRVKPHQKRAMVGALQQRGRCVAMTGDGVNDVLALKDADIGIAMGSGSAAARAAAQLVLLDGSFASLPPVVAEGRRVIGNIERVANLFLTKTTYSMLLALAIGVAGWPFPFLPRNLTLIGSLTIGAPAFFLALAPNTHRARPGFVARVLRFALPAGTVAATATFVAYAVARGGAQASVPLSRTEARTTATLALAAIGLLVLLRLSVPLTRWRVVLVLAMAGAFGLTIALPAGRRFFALDLPPLAISMWAAAIVAASWAVLLLWIWHAEHHAKVYERALTRLVGA